MPEEIVMIIVFAMLMVTGLGFGIMRTINRHLERKHGAAGDPQKVLGALEELRVQLDAVDDLRAQVADLEERLDFTERVIAQQAEHGRIPPKT